mmetsp:Transcript_32401/g.103656  ORF Transcript_32401/g.103656 Transcript_32401/m.103656 type:complete len:289 (-) Transcript_32401:841-1707(-)
MGVQGLLPFVSSASTEVSLEDFRGLTLACDASVWLHRGAISCARELAEGEPAVGFLRVPLRMIALLKRHGVRPLVVFDGGALPMKARVDAARAADRESAKARGEFNKTVKITAAMTQLLIERLRQDGVEFVVAPFEADSQLAFLVQHGHAAAALTEDSDLLAYRCPSVLFKLSENGHARRITFAGLQHAQDSKGQLLFDGAWEGEWAAWEGGLFVAMCIMAGCDYLPSVPGVGVATAHKALRAGRTVERALAKLHSKRSGPPAPVAAEAYLLHLRRCEAVFRHARVWV